MGTEGCEKFSTLVSKFLATMSDIIESHGGDIDCFAGDALLVVFSESAKVTGRRLSDLMPILCRDRSSSRSRSGGGNGTDADYDYDDIKNHSLSLRTSVRLALNCMKDICAELNGVTISPNSPSLNIHGALAAGTLYAVECGP